MLTSLYRFCFTCLILIFAGCSPEDTGGSDNPNNPTENPDTSENPSNPPLTGIAVKTLEIVYLEVNTGLNVEEYQGTFGNQDVTLLKVDENHLMVMVPSDMEEGIANLEVSSLGLEIAFDVSQVGLEGGSQEVFGLLLADVESKIENLGDSAEATFVADFWTEVEKNFTNATETEKREMALNYQVNKQLIDNILEGQIEGGVNTRMSVAKNSNKQSNPTSLTNLGKFTLAVASLGISSAASKLIKSKPKVRLFFIGIAVFSAGKAIKYHDYFSTSEFIKLNFFADEIPSSISRQQQHRIEFTHNVLENINLEIAQRKFNYNDAGSSNENVKAFLTAHYSLKIIVEKINEVIQEIKSALYITSDLGELKNIILEESEANIVGLSNTVFDNMDFSVASDKVEIVENTYQDGLKLKFKIKDIENLSQDYIDTKLNYSYSDDFNDFSGSFDIRVNKEEEFNYEGIWLLSFYYDESRNQKAWEYKIEMDANGSTISIYSRNYERWHEQWSEWTDYSSTTTFTMVYNLNTSQLRLIADNLNNVIYYFNVDSLEQTDFDVVNNTSYEGGRLEKL